MELAAEHQIPLDPDFVEITRKNIPGVGDHFDDQGVRTRCMVPVSSPASRGASSSTTPRPSRRRQRPPRRLGLVADRALERLDLAANARGVLRVLDAAQIDLDVQLRAAQRRRRAARTRPARRSTPTDCRARRPTTPCSAAAAQARITSSGAAIASRMAAWIAGRARRLLLVGRLRLLVGRHDQVVGVAVAIDRAPRARRAAAVHRSPAAFSRSTSSSVAARDLGRPATIASSDAPMAPASAAADPPPGVGSDDLKAARRSVTVRAVSCHDSRSEVRDASFRKTMRAAFDDAGDRRRADADQIDGVAGDEDGVHELAGFEAADRLRGDRASTRR